MKCSQGTSASKKNYKYVDFSAKKKNINKKYSLILVL